MTKTIENLFNYLAFYSHFLPVLFFLFLFNKSRSIRALWIVVAYDLYNYLTDIVILHVYHQYTQVFIYSSFTLIEYLLFTGALYLFIGNEKFKNWILALSIGFTIFIIIYNSTTKLRGIDSIPIGVETILIFIFAFYYLYEQMQDTANSFIYTRYPFWIVLGMMLYLSGSFFIYIYTSQLVYDKTIAHYWVFINIFSILKNIFFTIAILVNAYQPRKKQSLKYAPASIELN